MHVWLLITILETTVVTAGPMPGGMAQCVHMAPAVRQVFVEAPDRIAAGVPAAGIVALCVRAPSRPPLGSSFGGGA